MAVPPKSGIQYSRKPRECMFGHCHSGSQLDPSRSSPHGTRSSIPFVIQSIRRPRTVLSDRHQCGTASLSTLLVFGACGKGVGQAFGRPEQTTCCSGPAQLRLTGDYGRKCSCRKGSLCLPEPCPPCGFAMRPSGADAGRPGECYKVPHDGGTWLQVQPAGGGCCNPMAVRGIHESRTPPSAGSRPSRTAV